MKIKDWSLLESMEKNKYILDHIQFSADSYFDITIGYGVIMADFRRLFQ